MSEEEKEKTFEEGLVRRVSKIEEHLRYITVASIANLFFLLILLITLIIK
ncbi:MAG: hypothetical protein OEY22_05475 [Candidatus Bathyarchaeota archaeon]|nr:hypothetical protein [Candidatus Bathyarchaeota archaeon]MDH5788324.1 hypothetical protein [Candidatus Bathyarchaeota archaeon]